MRRCDDHLIDEHSAVWTENNCFQMRSADIDGKRPAWLGRSQGPA
jgi:hypothetical protein